jgi:hypothetical protein
MAHTTGQDHEVSDLLNEVTDSLMRLYVQQKHLFGAEDQYGSLDEIMNIVYRIHWAQEKLALRHEVAGERSKNTAMTACETV